MATILSLDPRVTRMNLDAEQSAPAEPKPALDQFQTFEVFHQVKTGAHHTHVGCVHAPSPELALLLAKEQYGRRGHTPNLWVVTTRDVVTLAAEAADVFATTPEKKYRDVGAYMVRDKVDAFKKQMNEGTTE